jgi:hypothetical protein
LGRALPVTDRSSKEEEEEAAPARTVFQSADYVLNNEEEATGDPTGHRHLGDRPTCFRREEAEAVHRVKQEVIDLTSE